MRIKIENEIIFGSVSTYRIPEFYKELTDKIIEFFKEKGVTAPDFSYKWEQWQENIDTGIYLYAGRITSVKSYSDWIVEGFIRSRSHYDDNGYIYTHKLMLQNSWRKVKIELTVLMGDGLHGLFFDLDLPAEFEKPFVERLLATS